MSKKLWAGILLGGAATGAAWALLPAAKRQAVKDQINAKVNQATDYATDYALNALDIVDEKLAEADEDGKFSQFAAGAKDVKDKALHKTDQLVDRFTNDDFDRQTAEIREELAKESEASDNDDDDIIIDKTTGTDQSTSDDQTATDEK